MSSDSATTESPPSTEPGRGWQRFVLAHPFAPIVATVAVIALLVTSGVVLKVSSSSRGAFSANTATSSNAWATGTINITNSSSGAAVFTANTLTAGNTLVKCIAATYSGTITSGLAVKMYATTTGSLGQYLDFTVEQGSGTAGTTGASGACTGFTPASTIYGGTLGITGTGSGTTFSNTYTNYANGLATWSPSANPDVKYFRITVAVQDNNAAQGLTATSTFTWEAQG
jgi:hypothetical protein